MRGYGGHDFDVGTCEDLLKVLNDGAQIRIANDVLRAKIYCGDSSNMPFTPPLTEVDSVMAYLFYAAKHTRDHVLAGDTARLLQGMSGEVSMLLEELWEDDQDLDQWDTLAELDAVMAAIIKKLEIEGYPSVGTTYLAIYEQAKVDGKPGWSRARLAKVG